MFKFVHSTFKFGEIKIQVVHSSLSRDTSLAMVMFSLKQVNLVRYYHLVGNQRNYHGMGCIGMHVQLELNIK